MVTQPDRPAGRGHKLVATPVKRAAEARGLRVLTPEKLRPFADEARALGANAFVVASYGKIVPQALLDVVPVAFNVHPSLLPLYRGATPLQSAIRDGRTETGVTIIAMDAGMDTGDVLLQERIPIGPMETYGELHDRLAKRGAEFAAEALQQYANGTLDRRPQSEVARELGIGDDEIARTLTRPWSKRDWILTFSDTTKARDVVNHVRALSPDPAARLQWTGIGPIKILEAHVADGPGIPYENLKPGMVEHTVGGSLWIRTSDGWVSIDRLTPPDRKPMTARDFYSGYKHILGQGVVARA
ncbi:MAG: methionyl-tRNA formyltransferase [Candidatus Eremiobacteraeota bacterium]|nr:methionyl-tRNA formyltransferase [Candidatus Eremiobacteraeota bacterium]